MIVYVSSEDGLGTSGIHSDICGMGNVAVACGKTYTGDQRDSLIAICDAMVIKDITNAVCLGDKKYAESLGIPIYTYPDLPEQHPTELRNPNQAKAFREITGQMYRMHLRKNADYSPANILGTGEIGLATRMWDKMARLLNLTGFNITISSSTFGVPKAPKNEAIEDTIMDLAVYSIISLIHRRGKWGN
jgi:hypothetical protein